MSEPIKTGDLATIIAGALGDKGPNVGKKVTVGLLRGEHSQHGRIWRVHGAGLTTEYGATGSEVDCATSWLRKDPPTPARTNTQTMEAPRTACRGSIGYFAVGANDGSRQGAAPIQRACCAARGT